MDVLDILNAPRTRQEKWQKLGYTSEQIENHLEFERRKARESREKRQKNNEKNKTLIEQIKKDLIGNTFHNSKVLSISPSTDGVGFWFKIYKEFKDGSSGEFRYFSHFSDYSKKDFAESLRYL